MKILSLANGEFQVYALKNNKFNVLAKKCNGHYSARIINSLEEVQKIIRAWTKCKYIYQCI